MSGLVQIRLSGERADIEQVLAVLAAHYGYRAARRPTWKPNRDDGGERAYTAVYADDDET